MNQQTPYTSLDLTDKEKVDFLAAALNSSLDAVISIDSKGFVLEWSRAAEEIFIFKKEEVVGLRLDELIIPSDFVAAHRLGLAKFLSTGENIVLNKRIELEAIDKNKNRFPVEISISPIYFRDSVFFTARLRNIEERRKYERQLLLTAKELAHREKNSLAIISSIFRQIAIYANSKEEFREKFDKWLVSYKTTHELLSMDLNSSISLLERVKLEFAPYDNGNNVLIEGVDVSLGRHAALNFGLCLHETVTNSVKHGSLSSVYGKVKFTSKIENDNLILLWEESGGPITSKPTKFGFGSKLLKLSLIDGLKGSYDYQFPKEGFIGKVSIPLSSLKGK